ncbi:MAG: NAD(P)H-binding protein, partial [Acidimicrobiia bacterium]
MKILVTGASGYIGGRLIPRLLQTGHEVRCLTRDARKLAKDSWRESVEVVEGDVLDRRSIQGALGGVDSAFYLVHSMEEGSHDFSDRDRLAAENFRSAADEVNLKRIVYL